MKVEKRDVILGVAVSGGADSMAMLDAYIKAGQNLVVINIEHGIRGADSVSDSRFVADYCKRNNLAFWALRSGYWRICYPERALRRRHAGYATRFLTDYWHRVRWG